jgi:ankyrin repeat protein
LIFETTSSLWLTSKSADTKTTLEEKSLESNREEFLHALIYAIDTNNHTFLRYIIEFEGGINFGAMDEDGNCARRLLSQRYSHEPNDQAVTRGYTFFHHAVEEGADSPMLCSLLSLVPDLTFINDAVHPIHIAVASHNHNAFRQLLQHHATRLGRYMGYRTWPITGVLSDCLKNPPPDALKYILEIQIHNPQWTWSLTGASDKYTTNDINSGTALHVAAYTNNRTAADVLLNYGCFVDSLNADSQTPLHVAAWRGNHEIVNLLLSRGANPNARDRFLETPAFCAFSQNDRKILDALRRAGADLSITNSDGLTILMNAICEGNPCPLASLGLGQYSLHVENPSGWTLFEYLSHHPHVNAFLLNSDCDLSYCSKRKGSVLNHGGLDTFELTRYLRRLPKEVVKTLINFKPERFVSALYVVATEGSARRIETLIKAGADLEVDGGPCGTPLIGACDAGKLENVKVLVRYGAKLTYQNKAGDIVSAVRAARYHWMVVRWLLVSRFTEQDKICQAAHISSEGKVSQKWSGFSVVEVLVPRRRGTSQLDFLQERNQVRKEYLGKVYDLWPSLK